MNARLSELCWPFARLGEAMRHLARRSASASRKRAAPDREEPRLRLPEGATGMSDVALDRWIEALASASGLEAERVVCSYGDVEELLGEAPPAVLRLSSEPDPEFLVVLQASRKDLKILDPELRVQRVRREVVRSGLCQQHEAACRHEVEVLVEAAGTRGQMAHRMGRVVLGELNHGAQISSCWRIRPPGTSGLAVAAREAGLWRLGLITLVSHIGRLVCWIASWWLLGRAALQGRVETGWLVAWGLMLLTFVACEGIASAVGGRLALRAGALVKRRLLGGAFAIDADELRRHGVGQLLGKVVESEVVEQASVAGALLALAAILELLAAAVVLVQGAGGWIHLGVLCGVLAVTVALAARYLRRRRTWTKERLSMTNALVEQMVGHRTRLAQEPPELWNDAPDAQLESYLHGAAELDRRTLHLQAILPRAWLLLGVLALAPVFVNGASTVTGLAVGIGGVLLAYGAFRSLGAGIEKLAACLVAWEQNKTLLEAATHRPWPGLPEHAAPTPSSNGAPVLTARDLVYRHRGRLDPVLRGVDLELRRGDRVLLEGASGGGKSTLGALLSGTRNVEAGLVLMHGLDRRTVGTQSWRRRIAYVPQFHDNHVFLGSFAFNVLMGRSWPPTPRDLQDAERVCRALSLGPLIDSMPAGMEQMVGETGWQLSDGERSRVFMARAILQGAEVQILDESFGALDPETLRSAMDCVLEHSRSLVVIGHP